MKILKYLDLLIKYKKLKVKYDSLITLIDNDFWEVEKVWYMYQILKIINAT